MVINVLMCEVRDHWFNAHSFKFSELNDQPRWLSPANKGSGRNPISHQGDSKGDNMSIPKRFLKRVWELLLRKVLLLYECNEFR